MEFNLNVRNAQGTSWMYIFTRYLFPGMNYIAILRLCNNTDDSQTVVK
jgi:hypothetical protein